MKQRTGSAKVFLDPDPAGEDSKTVKKLICSTLLPFQKVRHGITVLNMFKTVACGWEKPGRTRFFCFSNQIQNPKTVFFLNLVEIHIAKGFLLPCTHIHYYFQKDIFLPSCKKFSFTPAFTELGFCLYSECASFKPEFQVTSINLQIFIFSVYLNLLRERFNSRSLSYVQV